MEHAVDVDNGLWLCQNHHRLFDENVIKIATDGSVEYTSNLKNNDIDYMNYITTKFKIESEILIPKFIMYLSKRYKHRFIYDVDSDNEYGLVVEDGYI